MPELKEIFDMVSEKVEPELDSWNDQEQRQRRAARNRRLGTMTLAASIVIVVVVAALLALGDGSDRTADVPTRSVGTHMDLYLVDPATGDVQPVVVAKGYQGNGEVSPDGTRVVFEGSDPDAYGLTQIFVRQQVDGTIQQLTDLPNSAYAPTWSPDGQQITFSSSKDIFVMNADGTGVRRLTGSPGDDTDPDWSPDGKNIVFWSEAPRSGGYGWGCSSSGELVSFPPDQSEVWLGSISDGSVTQLTRNLTADEHPAWSPDGEWIAFAGNSVPIGCFTSLGPNRLWLMRPDGTQRHRVSGAPHESDRPAWSPDGGQIAFVGAGRLHVVDLATGETQIIWDAPIDFVAWGPTGILVSAFDPEPGDRG